ncbi:molybdenum import ATP-binding protein ModC [Clostridium aceticum]|uniref:Molybdenum import ATP-binding protein ModC n=1 Tax=Clostridium aceticum TaxID=84022 RepID=A0A0D8IF12_9CLOT|nr:ATP-binding cassette domain-containing protein [Clostridium aceticum]AKL94873.1 molybdenum import ATP-binding protein ModC [Clostridium aceticum]KJF27801.1 hypothetical protein TZ02_04150 [Clostridium aceticum]
MINIEIKKQYNGFQLEVNFKAYNEVLVILGSSGAGKSTILNCIAGMVYPDAGKIFSEDFIFFDSEKNINMPVFQRRVGYVFQSYGLFPHMTVDKNIRYGLKNYPFLKGEERFDPQYLMESFKISHLKNKYPYQLSGGEKQRVALVRTLVLKPRILLLDEPFCALDYGTKKVLYNEFMMIKSNWNIPIILITHDEEEAKLLGDRRLRLRNGRVLEEMLKNCTNAFHESKVGLTY